MRNKIKQLLFSVFTMKGQLLVSKTIIVLFLSFFIGLIYATTSFAESTYKNIYDTKGRLICTIAPDHSIVQYTYDNNGNVKSKQFINDKVYAPSEASISDASYDAYVYGVSSEIVRVLFPTWTESKGQDDLEWMNGQKVAEGVWKVTVPFSKHNNETGLYITHVYGFDAAGNETFFGGTSTRVN